MFIYGEEYFYPSFRAALNAARYNHQCILCNCQRSNRRIGGNRLESTRRLVGVTGVEPVTSSLSGTRSNQLSYTPGCVGGGNGTRTRDFQLAKLALYQLSYAPVVFRPRDPQAQFASDAFTFSNIHAPPAFEAEVVR